MNHVGTAFVDVKPDLSGFTRDVNRQIAQQTGGIKQSFAAVGKAAVVGLAAGTVAFATLGRSAISAATDINESLSKNRVLFGKHAKGVEAFAKTSAKSYGISRKAALEYTGVFGNLFRALGESEKSAAAQSVALTRLAADMASFNNTSIEDALEAVRSGLVGETEPLRRFGVNMNDATLKAQALKMGLISSTKDALDPHAKALAASALITSQTSKAHGDFARTSGGLANQTRILKAQFDDASAALGQRLLPFAIKVVGGLNQLIASAQNGTGVFGYLRGAVSILGDAISAVFAPVKQLVSAFAQSKTALLATAGALGVVAGAFASTLIASAAAAAVNRLRTALVYLRNPLLAIQLLLIANPWTALITALAALTAGFIIAYRESKWFHRAVDDIADAISGAAATVWNEAQKIGAAIVDGVLAGVSFLYGALKQTLEATLLSVLSGLNPFSPVSHGGEKYIGRPLGEGALRGWVLGSAPLPERLASTVRAAVERARGQVDALRGRFQDAWGRLATDALDAFDRTMGKRKTPAEIALAQFGVGRDAKQQARAIRDARERFAEAQGNLEDVRRRFGNAQATLAELRDAERAVRNAQEAFDDLMADQQESALAARAATEREALDEDIALKRRHFSDRLDQLAAALGREGATQKQAHAAVQRLFREFGIDYKESGASLGSSFVKGLDESLNGASGAAAAIKKLLGKPLTVPPGVVADKPKVTGGGKGSGGGVGPAGGLDVPGSAGSPFDEVKTRVDEVVGKIKAKLAELSGPLRDVRGWFKDAFNGPLAQDVGRIFGKVKATVVSASGDIATAAGAIWGRFGDSITGIVRGNFTAVAGIVRGALQIIRGYIQLFTGIITGDWRKAWDGIKNIARGTWTAIESLIRGAWENIKGTVRIQVALVGTILSTAWRGIRTTTGTAWATIREAILTPLRAARDTGETVVNALGAKIGKAFASIVTAAKTFGGNVKEKIVDAFDGAADKVKAAVNRIIGFLNKGLKFAGVKIPELATGGKISAVGVDQALATGGQIRRGLRLTHPTVLMGEEAPCIAEGTLVETAGGRRTIESVTAGERVLTRNGYREVLWSGITRRNAEVLRVTSDNGDNVLCTPDHRIWTARGDDDGDGRSRSGMAGTPQRAEACWREARELAVGDWIWALAAGGELCATRIASIEPAARIDTYDLVVDRDHEFVAGGILVHNSHPEFVIPTNPAYRERALNLTAQLLQDLGVPLEAARGAVIGYARGGVIGKASGILGDIGKAVGGAAKGVLDLPLKLIEKGASWIIDQLPNPADRLPKWLTGLGSFAISRVTTWVKEKVKGLLGSSEGGVGGGGGIVALGRRLQRMGYQVGEHPAFGGVAPVHTQGSYHYRGRAIDVNANGWPGGEAAALDRLAAMLRKLPGVVELLWRTKGHYDHLHVAMRQGGIIGGDGVSIAPFVGSYANGGVVPRDGFAYVHQGEKITPQAAGDVNVRVFIGERELTDIVRVEVDESDRRKGAAYRAGVI